MVGKFIEERGGPLNCELYCFFDHRKYSLLLHPTSAMVPLAEIIRRYSFYNLLSAVWNCVHYNENESCQFKKKYIFDTWLFS